MKKSLMALAAIVTLAVGCTNKNSYTLTLNVPEEFKGQTLVMFSPVSGDTIATKEISDTTVVFKGHTEEPQLVMLTCQNIPLAGAFVIEPGDITLTEDGAIGTPYNDQFMELQDSALADDTDGIALATDFVQTNPQNPYSYLLINQFGYMFTPEVLNAYIAAVPDKADDPMIKTMLDAATTRAKTSAGGNYIDFEGEDAEGKEISLTPIVTKSKYTVLDFWAPWCGPCCREIPNLENLYETYKDKGLAVVGAEVWRRDNNDPYAKAKELGITYPVMFNVDKRVTEEYGILAIPTILIIDNQGTIIARDIMGEQLTAMVDSIMK